MKRTGAGAGTTRSIIRRGTSLLAVACSVVGGGTACHGPRATTSPSTPRPGSAPSGDGPAGGTVREGEFDFAIVPATGEMSRDGAYTEVGWIEVRAPGGAAVLQRLPVLMENEAGLRADMGVGREDIDFDGDQDLCVYEHGGATWGRFHWWLFDARDGRFHQTALKDALQSLVFADYRVDPRTRTLTVVTWNGAHEMVEQDYRVDGDQVRLVAERTGAVRP